MSQYGYGHGLPPHQASQPYGFAPHQTYTAPSTYQNGIAEADPTGYGNETREPYEYNHAAIPGLGMGFPSTDAGWPQPWGQVLPNSQPEKVEPIASSHPAKPDDDTANNAMEEGELSEGAEDIYEPGDLEGTGDGDRATEQQDNMAMESVNDHSNHQLNQTQQQYTRDKSGSYSPYLSPREIQSDGQGNGASHTG